MNRHKRCTILIICITLILSLTGCGNLTGTSANTYNNTHTSNSNNISISQLPEDATYTTSITMLDVGQGLSLLLESEGEYMLYDGGGRNYSSYVVSYLEQHQVDELKYMFTSHYDEDHINGQVGVLNTEKIDLVVRPDYVHNSKLYQSYLDMLDKNGAPSEFPSVGDTFALGSATITVLAPDEYSNNTNDNSIAIKITDGAFNCIITGDAEVDSEAKMLAGSYLTDCDLYVAGHHGSSSSSSEAFIEAIKPEYAFISVGAGNSYGHPTEQTMATFKSNNVQVFRTDMQGEVTCYTNGNNYWFSQDPCNDYSAGTNKKGTDDSGNLINVPESEAEYVLNTNSMKFHRPDCQYAKRISEENKKYSIEDREELIKQGYEPCGTCNP